MSVAALLDPRPPPSRAMRLAALLVLAAAAGVVVASGAYAHELQRATPTDVEHVRMWHLGDNESFVVWDHMGSGGQRYELLWHAHVDVDRVLVMDARELARMVAGEAPRVVREYAAGRGGHLSLEPVVEICHWNAPCENGPVVAWVRGDAWIGRALNESRLYDATFAPDGEMTSISARPVVVRGMSEWVGRYDAAWKYLTWGAASALVGAGAAAAYVALGRRAPLVTPAPATAVRGATTPDLVLLAHASSLYHDARRRQFVLWAAFIALVVVALMQAYVPWALDAIERLYPFGGADAIVLYHWLAVPFLGALALSFWLVAYLRERDDLRRWRDAARDLERQAQRLLGE